MILLHAHIYMKAYTAFIAVKAVVMTVVAFAVDVTFVKSLALVSASAIVTGAFGIIVALIQRDADKRLHSRIDTIEQRQVANVQAVQEIANATGAQTATETTAGASAPASGEAKTGAGGEGTATPGR